MATDEYYYEVCFTVSPDSRTNEIRYVKPDHLFYGTIAVDIVFNVRADSEEDAEEKARKLLADPGSGHVGKYGPGMEVKTKYVRRVLYM